MSTPTRTELRPMAFTRREFWRGAWGAWGLFMAMLPVLTVVWNIPVLFTREAGLIIITLMYAVPIAGIVSLAAMLLFSPVAWLLGRALQRVAARGIHLAAFTLFGAVVGLVAMSTWLAASGFTYYSWLIWTHVAASAAAVGFSWWRTADRALHEDFGAAEYRRRTRWLSTAGDADASFEDRALGG